MVKLGSFGLDIQQRHVSSAKNADCGTFLYMASEVYEGAAVLKSDVWSLGVSIVEMAEGKNPYASCAVKEAVCNGAVPSLSSGSSDLADFVSKCLVKDVHDRCSVEALMEVSIRSREVTVSTRS